ncbi:hypothetical protein ASZ78_006510 [Callipepla squamata]|uniref:CD44 antigen n=1 Tax=Callipepla squamata TaxID=9009 RepID=A0A226N6Q3_CALSU|nr:hypothetical protein ASZ78_006510 [Callipepla squamata]
MVTMSEASSPIICNFLSTTEFNVSCRYGGVFHVEKNGRYSLTRTEAIELCRALNSTLATLEQFERAHELGFETCRYGFIVGHIVIPRINPYHLCAANHTGIYRLSANTTGRYDAYCYNATESRSKTCEPVERIDISFLSNQSEIVIDNEDGSRYNPDGTRHSGDSSTSGVDDENLGSGSIHDTTPGDTSIRRSSPSYYGSVTPISHMPDHSSGGGEKEFPVNYDGILTSTDTLTTAADFPKEDDVQHTTSTTLVTSETEKRQGPTQHPLLHSVHYGWISQGQNPENTTVATEQHHFTLPGENNIEKETSYTAMVSNHGAKQNDSAQDPLVYPGWGKEDYSTQPTVMDRIIPSRESNHEKESSNTALATPDDGHHEDPTQPPLPSDNEAAQGTEGITHPTDAPGGPVLLGLAPTSVNEAGDESLLSSTINLVIIVTVTASNDVLKPEDVTQEAWTPQVIDTAHATPDDVHHEDPTQPPLPSDNEAAQGTEGITHPTDAPGGPVLLGLDPTSMNEAGDESLLSSTRSTSDIDSDQGPYKGDSEPTPFPGESTATTVITQPRSAPVPEWLIIVAALLVLALILAVCIAVNSRRRCGQKKKLVINNGKGAVEDRKTRELNGDASKSQEMVHLVHKEQSNDQTGACDEFLTIDETQNHQEADMKSGV